MYLTVSVLVTTSVLVLLPTSVYVTVLTTGLYVVPTELGVLASGRGREVEWVRRKRRSGG